MNESEFAALAGAAMTDIERRLEASGADIDFELAAGGVLEIEFADGSKIIVNRHAAAREIWVAARAGGFHFRHDGGVWRDTRDGEELLAKLARLASAQAGETVDLGA
ncbi:MAG: iron donor protein CyaY [Rhodocyclaceae bacterium]|nr:iron donor protein CyaY [Rhodocyclaceae bacterium]